MLTTDEGRPSNMSISLNVVQRYLLHYRAFACKSLVKVEIKLKKKEKRKFGNILITCS